MSRTAAIMRRWSGRVRSDKADEYLAYVASTGGTDYSGTDGNLGYQILRRDLGNGETEICTISWWSSWDAIRRFAGPEPARARYYPEDDRFLLDRPAFVDHFDVVAGSPMVNVEG